MLHMDLNDRLRALVHARDLDVKRTHKSGMNEGVRTLTQVFFVWLEIYCMWCLGGRWRGPRTALSPL